MENHFTLHAAVLKEEIVQEVKATVQCLNCGDHQSAQELQCTACRFPLAEVKVRTVTSLSAKLGKRVG
ncbi:MAG: ribosomal protein L37E [Saprospiraceae bacterium]|jgi:ribosomal protein L37E